MLLPRKALLVDIFFILAATNLMIAAFALGCLAFYKQLVYITIGNLTFPHQSGDEVIRAMYIPPVNDSVDFNPGFRLSWLNTLSPLSDGPYDSWSQCEICPGRFVSKRPVIMSPQRPIAFKTASLPVRIFLNVFIFILHRI
uniref:Polypeptide 5 n=1 Tax=Alcelaphine gammaherpesvirus 1 TaxID=35252 RepID=Q9YKL0_9GAMA|nr:polypeptide 5 [Alcelaphine gammaherpesvirus 1]